MVDVPAGKKVRFPFAFKTSGGEAAEVDGVPTVTATLGTVVEVVPGAGKGEFSALIDPQGVGEGKASGTADVDRGEGVKPLAFELGDYKALASDEAALVEVGSPTVE